MAKKSCCASTCSFAIKNSLHQSNSKRALAILKTGKRSIEVLSEFGIGVNNIQGLLQAGLIIDSNNKSRL